MRLAVVAVLVLQSASCLLVPRDPGADVVIACTGDRDCPSTWRCVQLADGGRCFEQLPGAADAPVITDDPVIEPLRLREGGEVTVGLRVNKRLAEPPTLTLNTFVEPREVPCVTKNDGRTEFVCAYTARGDEIPQGDDEAFAPLVVRLVSEGGEDSGSVSLGRGVTFDFVAPHAVQWTITPTLATVGDIVTVRVRLNEAICERAECAAPALVAFDGEESVFQTALETHTAGVLTFSRVIAATDQGRLRFRVGALEDEAGNHVTSLEAPVATELVVDVTPPEVEITRVGRVLQDGTFEETTRFGPAERT